MIPEPHVEMFTIKPKLIPTVLHNPGIGFTTFQRFNGDIMNEGLTWTEGYPIESHPNSKMPDNEDFYPTTTIAYFRLYWRFLEPSKGQYQWDLIDRLLFTSRQRGQRLMLRIAPYGPDETADVPDWYRKLVGKESKNNLRIRKWRIDHDDPLYVDHFTKMARALGNRYDGHPDLDSVDLSIIGMWGEGEGSDLLAQSTREALVNAYTESFLTTPLLAQLTDPRTNQYALSRADVGWRVDCLGDMGGCWDEGGDWSHMLDAYPFDIIRCGVQDVWKRAPVSLEACWVMRHWRDKGWDIEYIIEQSLKWHISSFNAKSSPVPREWQPFVENWLKRMGYRLALRHISYPAIVHKEGMVIFRMWWENLGVAPCYLHYLLAFRIANDRTVHIFLTNADIRNWLPGDHLVESQVELPKELLAGHYVLDVAIVNPMTQNPILELAMEGKLEDGWYRLATLQIIN